MGKQRKTEKKGFGQRKKYYSKAEKAAFYDGLSGKFAYGRNYSSAEQKSWRRGFDIFESDDYKLAAHYTSHMNRKFGSFDNENKPIKDSKGRQLGIDGRPMPSAYENYKEMKKNDEFRCSLYEAYT